MAGLSESLALGGRMGMDLPTLSRIINASSGRSWSSERYNPVPGVSSGTPASNDYAAGFSTALMKKDIALALQMAKDCIDLPMGKLVQRLYGEIADEKKDFSIIYQTFKK